MANPCGHRGVPSAPRWGGGCPRLVRGLAAIPPWTAQVWAIGQASQAASAVTLVGVPPRAALARS